MENQTAETEKLARVPWELKGCSCMHVPEKTWGGEDTAHFPQADPETLQEQEVRASGPVTHLKPTGVPFHTAALGDEQEL